MTTKIFGDLIVTGTLTAGSINSQSGSLTNAAFASNAGIARSKLDQDDLQPYAVVLTDFRVHDAPSTYLPTTAAADDLGLIEGTYGSDPVYLSTGDVKATSTTRYARFFCALPPEYVSGESVAIRVYGGMFTTVADTSATLDVVAYSHDKAGTVTADLVTSTAVDINILGTGVNELTYTVNGGLPLFPGDELDVRVEIAIVDSATVSAVEGRIYAVALLCDIKG